MKKKPRQLQWQDINVENLGYRIFEQNQKQYLGEKVAEWKLDVQPRPKHFDRRITVATPLQKAGAYLLTAKLADGNSSHIILWLEDTAIVKKPLDHGTFYFVADAVSAADFESEPGIFRVPAAADRQHGPVQCRDRELRGVHRCRRPTRSARGEGRR